jgi:hypothetical protein
MGGYENNPAEDLPKYYNLKSRKELQMMFRLLFSIFLGTMLIFGGCEKETPTAGTSNTADPAWIPASEDEGFAKWGRFRGSVRVMTRNVYVGADLDTIFKVDPLMIPLVAPWIFQMMLSTDFSERAQALADEVALGRPHLIGLQEISLIRIQSPGDAAFGGTVPAETVFLDFLPILMDALQQRGLNYQIAGKVENLDVEVPMYTGTNPIPFDDVRLTDYDVVLARHDVDIDNVVEQNYQTYLPVPGFGIPIYRGFIALEASVRGKCYLFVNTHLESEIQAVRHGQAQELMAYLQNETKPIILVGDLNTRASGEPTYQYLIGEGFVDAWDRNLVPFNRDGYTSSHDPDLRNTVVKLDHRIDLILVKSHKFVCGRQIIGPVLAFVVGDELRDRTPSGLWPSDHAGVIARLKIPVMPVR